jgi:hypothetical protein
VDPDGPKTCGSGTLVTTVRRIVPGNCSLRYCQHDKLDSMISFPKKVEQKTCNLINIIYYSAVKYKCSSMRADVKGSETFLVRYDPECMFPLVDSHNSNWVRPYQKRPNEKKLIKEFGLIRLGNTGWHQCFGFGMFIPYTNLSFLVPWSKSFRIPDGSTSKNLSIFKP